MVSFLFSLIHKNEEHWAEWVLEKRAWFGKDKNIYFSFHGCVTAASGREGRKKKKKLTSKDTRTIHRRIHEDTSICDLNIAPPGSCCSLRRSVFPLSSASTLAKGNQLHFFTPPLLSLGGKKKNPFSTPTLIQLLNGNWIGRRWLFWLAWAASLIDLKEICQIH